MGDVTERFEDEVDEDRTSVLQRVRAIVGLVGMVVILGALAAATLGVVVVGLAAFIDQALE